jgi:hypothetical protein
LGAAGHGGDASDLRALSAASDPGRPRPETRGRIDRFSGCRIISSLPPAMVFAQSQRTTVVCTTVLALLLMLGPVGASIAAGLQPCRGDASGPAPPAERAAAFASDGNVRWTCSDQHPSADLSAPLPDRPGPGAVPGVALQTAAWHPSSALLRDRSSHTGLHRPPAVLEALRHVVLLI